jgi:hypothetical protein
MQEHGIPKGWLSFEHRKKPFCISAALHKDEYLSNACARCGHSSQGFGQGAGAVMDEIRFNGPVSAGLYALNG